MQRVKTPLEDWLFKDFLIELLVKYVLLVLAMLILTACTPKVQMRYVTQPLSRPERPVLPHVKADELECLAKDSYQRLYDRQRLLREYALTLEAIIDTTHGKEDKF